MLQWTEMPPGGDRKSMLKTVWETHSKDEKIGIIGLKGLVYRMESPK
jgi:hypothetical protein